MYTVRNFSDNDDVKVLDAKGPFQVIEYQRDLSVMPENAATAYFASEMNIRKRQLMCQVGGVGITLQSGAMQWTLGDVNATTGIKGVGDFFGKAVRGKVTGSPQSNPSIRGVACSFWNLHTGISSSWISPIGEARSSSMTVSSLPVNLR